MRSDNTFGIGSNPSRASGSGRWTTLFGCAFLLLGTHCAVYDDTWQSGLALAAENAGGSAGHAAADNDSLVSHPASAAGGTYAGAGGSAVASGGTGGQLPAEGATWAAGSNMNVPVGQGVGGVIGVGGTAVLSDGDSTSTRPSGGRGGYGGYGGGAVASESWTDNNLSRGRPARADSEQTTQQHYASDANDGDRSTRWCAADFRVNHYWEIDLGKSYSLSTLRILWEKDAGYLFKVESSVDDESWSLVLDKTDSNSATANQQHVFAPGATGRYVRITVTGGLAPNIWASFYELDIFGH